MIGFSAWIKNRIKQYGFTENQDFVTFDKIIKNLSGGSDFLPVLGESKSLWPAPQKNGVGQELNKLLNTM